MDLERIYQDYFSKVYYYVLSMAKDPAVAEEITQETFFRAMKNLNKFRGECAVHTWLCQIAKNAYLNYLNKHSRLESLEDYQTEPKNEGDSIEEKLSKKEFSFKIHKVLHKMKEPYKEVFLLRVYGELSFKEIGEIFDRTDTWARVTYHRSRNIIREAVGNEYKL